MIARRPSHAMDTLCCLASTCSSRYSSASRFTVRRSLFVTALCRNLLHHTHYNALMLASTSSPRTLAANSSLRQIRLFQPDLSL